MKKTTWILAILGIALNTSLTYTTPENNKIEKEQYSRINTSGCSYNSHCINQGTTKVKIHIDSSGCSTNEIHIPSSVKKIDLEGRLSGCSVLTLYMRHTPTIKDSTTCSGCARVQMLHPARKYTYHFIGAAALLGLLYYLKSDK